MFGAAPYLMYEHVVGARQAAELIGFSKLSWHFLAIVTNGRDPGESVNALVAAARFMLVGAYDGESFLYTQPDGTHR